MRYSSSSELALIFRVKQFRAVDLSMSAHIATGRLSCVFSRATDHVEDIVNICTNRPVVYSHCARGSGAEVNVIHQTTIEATLTFSHCIYF